MDNLDNSKRKEELDNEIKRIKEELMAGTKRGEELLENLKKLLGEHDRKIQDIEEAVGAVNSDTIKMIKAGEVISPNTVPQENMVNLNDTNSIKNEKKNISAGEIKNEELKSKEEKKDEKHWYSFFKKDEKENISKKEDEKKNNLEEGSKLWAEMEEADKKKTMLEMKKKEENQKDENLWKNEPKNKENRKEKTKKEKPAPLQKINLEEVNMGILKIIAEVEQKTGKILTKEERVNISSDFLIKAKEEYKKKLLEASPVKERIKNAFSKTEKWWTEDLEKTTKRRVAKTVMSAAFIGSASIATAIGAGVTIPTGSIPFRILQRVGLATGFNIAASTDLFKKTFGRITGIGKNDSIGEEGKNKFANFYTKNLGNMAALGGIGFSFFMSGGTVALIGAGGFVLRKAMNAYFGHKLEEVEEKMKANRVGLETFGKQKGDYDINSIVKNLDKIENEYAELVKSAKKIRRWKGFASGTLAMGVGASTIAFAIEHAKMEHEEEVRKMIEEHKGDLRQEEKHLTDILEKETKEGTERMEKETAILGNEEDEMQKDGLEKTDKVLTGDINKEENNDILKDEYKNDLDKIEKKHLEDILKEETKKGTERMDKGLVGLEEENSAGGKVREEIQINKDAIIGKGEGIEHSLIRQIMNKDTAVQLGYKGDLNDEEALRQFAGVKAHLICLKTGYVDTNGNEVRVGEAGKVAYELKIENGEPVIVEKSVAGEILETHNKGEAFEKEPDKHEYIYKKEGGAINDKNIENENIKINKDGSETSSGTKNASDTNDFDENRIEKDEYKNDLDQIEKRGLSDMIERETKDGIKRMNDGLIDDISNQEGDTGDKIDETEIIKNIKGKEYTEEEWAKAPENIYRLSISQFIEVNKTYQDSIQKLFSIVLENTKDTVNLGDVLQSGKAEAFIGIENSGVGNTYLPLWKLINNLHEITGLEPKEATPFHPAETNENYIYRAMSKAMLTDRISEVKRIEL